jgi:hypothetical protein
MKATSLLLQSDRFAVEWGDDVDSIPPPGHEFANALLKRLRSAGAGSQLEELPLDWWEHSCWFFDIIWMGETYHLTLEPSPMASNPRIWCLGVSRRLRFFQAIFGGRALRHEVDDAFLSSVENCTKETAGADSIEWVTEDEAIERFWGGRPKQRGQAAGGNVSSRTGA